MSGFVFAFPNFRPTARRGEMELRKYIPLSTEDVTLCPWYVVFSFYFGGVWAFRFILFGTPVRSSGPTPVKYATLSLREFHEAGAKVIICQEVSEV